MSKMPQKKIIVFRANIRRELSRRKMTQIELAQRAKVSHIWLCKVLNGRSNPTLPFCEGLARGLDTSLEALLAEPTSTATSP